jgi:aminomethyltransferase
VRALRYFWFQEATIEGIRVTVARSGWSKQGGFELYLMDGTQGTKLWNIVKEAGKPWDIGPGTPNFCERVESGLLSYGGDTDAATNPFEVRMEKYVDLQVADEVIGIEALRRIHAAGPPRHQLGVVLEGDEPTALGFHWHSILKNGQKVGDLTNCVWSYRLKKNIGFALIARTCAAGDRVDVVKEGHTLPGTLKDLPFL